MSGASIDRAYLATMCGEDAEFEKELIEAYTRDSPGLLSRVADGVTSGDASAVENAAHTLKGSSRAIGAEEVGQVADVLEQKGRSGELEGAEAVLVELQRAYAELEVFAQANWPE